MRILLLLALVGLSPVAFSQNLQEQQGDPVATIVMYLLIMTPIVYLSYRVSKKKGWHPAPMCILTVLPFTNLLCIFYIILFVINNAVEATKTK